LFVDDPVSGGPTPGLRNVGGLTVGADLGMSLVVGHALDLDGHQVRRGFKKGEDFAQGPEFMEGVARGRGRGAENVQGCAAHLCAPGAVSHNDEVRISTDPIPAGEEIAA